LWCVLFRSPNSQVLQRRRKPKKRRRYGNGGRRDHVRMVSSGQHWNTKDHSLPHPMKDYLTMLCSIMMGNHTLYVRLLKRFVRARVHKIKDIQHLRKIKKEKDFLENIY